MKFLLILVAIGLLFYTCQIVFLTLKISGAIAWSFWLVLLPSMPLLVLLFFAMPAILMGIASKH